MECLFIVITPRSTLNCRSSNCYGPIFGSKFILFVKTVCHKHFRINYKKCKYDCTMNAIPKPLGRLFIYFFTFIDTSYDAHISIFFKTEIFYRIKKNILKKNYRFL